MVWEGRGSVSGATKSERHAILGGVSVMTGVLLTDILMRPERAKSINEVLLHLVMDRYSLRWPTVAERYHRYCRVP